MSPPPLSEWLIAFVWTNALELPVYLLVLRGSFARWWAPVALTLLLNTVTHPLLWYVWFVHLWFEPSWLWLTVSEAWVTLTEAVLVGAALTLTGRPRRAWLTRALPAAVAANVTSTLLGMLLVR